MSETLRALAEAHGIHAGFHDFHGTWRGAEPHTLRALLRGMGVDAETDAIAQEALDAVRANARTRHLPEEATLTEGKRASIKVAHPCRWEVEGEDGAVLASGKAETALDLPPLPFGYHLLQAKGEGWRETVLLLCRPAKGAPSVRERAGVQRAWGLCGALYGLRSQTNGGMGSYRDLEPACRAFAAGGAQFFGINPIHALGWGAPEVLSPYSPTHRGYFGTDHIAVDGMGPTPEAALIDHDAFRTRHRAALEAEFAAFEGAKAFDAFCAARPDLVHFATFEALSEKHGSDSRRWPADAQRPGKTATRSAGKRTGFHQWLQWRAESQIDAAQAVARDAGMGLGLYLDLAVGARPGGAESWMSPETVAPGISIGAPPDFLNPAGQSWNLSAHSPRALAANRYHPLRDMLARLMAKAGILRIDHALGLLRSFWQPEDGSPGGYVTQPFESLLSVIAIEARRAGCLVIGEDLGLVPPGFRETMNAAGLLSYAVWQYETEEDDALVAPETLRARALSCFGTHDTPTLAGFWYGCDVALWQEMGWVTSAEADARHGARSLQRSGLRALCDLPGNADTAQIVAAIHARLGEAPSQLTALQLDDLFLLTDAQNLPGTIDDHPNWRRRLPVAVEDFADAPELSAPLPDRDAAIARTA